MDPATIIVTILGISSLTLLPGFIFSIILFPRSLNLSFSERFGLSIILGLVPYLILYFLSKNLNIPVP